MKKARKYASTADMTVAINLILLGCLHTRLILFIPLSQAILMTYNSLK